MLSFLLVLFYFSIYGKRSTAEPEFAVAFNYPNIPSDENDIPICHTRGLSLNAKSALIIENKSGGWIYSKRPMRVRPIASLTKLLTAMVYLNTFPNLDTTVYISSRDCYESAKSHIYKGEAYKARDLLYAALMSSDNRAARAIALSVGRAA